MIYWFPLGTYSAIYCPFCLETCKKEEAEQIPGSGIIEDKFWCSNKDEAWHEQIERIKEEYNKTSSHTLRAILQKDIEDILNSKKASI